MKKKTRRVDSPWLTVKEAAEYLGIGTDAIYEACSSGALKSSRLGRASIRLRREWLDAFAERFIQQIGPK